MVEVDGVAQGYGLVNNRDILGATLAEEVEESDDAHASEAQVEDKVVDQDDLNKVINEFQQLLEWYLNEVETSGSSPKLRDRYRKELNLLCSRCLLAVGDSGERVRLLSDIENEFNEIIYDIRRARAEKERGLSTRDVEQVIIALQLWDNLRSPLSQAINKAVNDFPNLDKRDQLIIASQQMDGFKTRFENLVRELFNDDSIIIKRLMDRNYKLNEGDLIAAAAYANMNSDRRSFCLTEIRNGVNTLFNMLSNFFTDYNLRELNTLIGALKIVAEKMQRWR